MKVKYNKTKIVCTIGPACWDPEILEKMIRSGMDVARVNAAFSDVAELERVAKLIRTISTDVALMLDIKGNDVRCNDFDSPINLKKGDELIIGNKPEDGVYPKNHPELYKDMKVGDKVYFDDGKVVVEITKIEDGKMYTKTIVENELKPGKSMNTPGVRLSLPTITSIDKEQIDFAIKDDWDFVAASYVRDGKDAQEVRDYLKGTDLKIIAKIEEPLGVENIDEILKIVDGVMVARGDMAVEMPYERIFAIQKMLIAKCNAAGKPVITATQVVYTMTQNPFPTRAEITDVANAVWDGTDAIMTSGETSVGKYPVEAVETIATIAYENEQYLEPTILEPFQLEDREKAVAIANAAFELAVSTDATKIIVMSQSGTTVRLMARYNLPMKIYAFVTKEIFKRQLAMTKNVVPMIFTKKHEDRTKAIEYVIESSLEKGIITKTDKVIIVGNASKDYSKFSSTFEFVDMKEYLKD